MWFLPPGMIAAMTRHLKSLRHMQRDHGWIHTLLEEAENERMHLLTALVLRKPGPIFKFAVVGAQGELVMVASFLGSSHVYCLFSREHVGGAWERGYCDGTSEFCSNEKYYKRCFYSHAFRTASDKSCAEPGNEANAFMPVVKIGLTIVMLSWVQLFFFSFAGSKGTAGYEAINTELLAKLGALLFESDKMLRIACKILLATLHSLLLPQDSSSPCSG